MLMASTVPAYPICPLEATLEKHTEMFDKILQAIHDSKTAMKAQLGEIQVETRQLQADYSKFVNKMYDAESSLMSIRPTMATMQDHLKIQ
ncbi:hypothetical protein NDU88_002232 [Pleurodeles waltl]|uniref:Uncharacterized protein n=1 Tax=Pleurodeles waltl TaxID=8319 RepID=A0AAV7Q8C1_PLEWA|nr:hypothetical protein NDU88_002232 [Pleurodeles waltl]